MKMIENKGNLNEEAIRFYYKQLQHEEETEIRHGIENNFSSDFVHSADAFLYVCQRWNGIHNIYAGLNERKQGGTKSEHVITADKFRLDIERKESKRKATEEEIDKAEKVADKIMLWFKEQGFDEPLKAFTGNGFALICYHKPFKELNQQKRNSIAEKYNSFFEMVKQKFETEDIKIDKTHDLARVDRVIGTWNLKGERLSFFCNAQGFERKDNLKLIEFFEGLKIEKPGTARGSQAKVKLTAWEILRKKHPDNQERCSCVLKIFNRQRAKGWGVNEICEYIAKNCVWDDYDPVRTRTMIEDYLSRYFENPNPLTQKKAFRLRYDCECGRVYFLAPISEQVVNCSCGKLRRVVVYG
ncbi:MAG: hypothetical protein V1494_01135 [Candidatus Diapherotrites archaeon]